MLKDRGTIKWTSMMLTEHVQLLKQWEQEERFIEKPDLTSWELEDLQQIIEQAARTQQQLELMIWTNGQQYSYLGAIKKLNIERQELHFETLTETKQFSLTSIIVARLLDDCYD